MFLSSLDEKVNFMFIRHKRSDSIIILADAFNKGSRKIGKKRVLVLQGEPIKLKYLQQNIFPAVKKAYDYLLRAL